MDMSKYNEAVLVLGIGSTNGKSQKIDRFYQPTILDEF